MFGVHGVGGMTGTLLAGVFAVGALSATRKARRRPGLLEGNPRQVLIQLYGVVVTLVWSGVSDFRDPEGDRLDRAVARERGGRDIGLDITLHGEALQ